MPGTKHRVVAAAVAAVAVTGAAGCGSSSPASNAAGASGKHHKITLVVGLKGDDFYGSMACGAKAEAKSLGASLNVVGADKWDASQQIPVLNSVISAHPDAILIAPVDDTALQAPLQQAASAGIKVVLVDTTLKDPSLAASQVTSDNELAGEKAAEELGKEVGGKGSVVTVNTMPGVSTVEARVKGFEKGLKKFPGIKYLGQQYSGDDAAKAAGVVTSSLSAHPDLDGVFAVNTLTGQGAATGIKNAHKEGKIRLIGFDANPSGVQAIQDGSAQGQVVLKPLDIGSDGVQQAVNALDGKSVNKMILTGSFVGTKQNLDTPDVQKYLYRSSCTG